MSDLDKNSLRTALPAAVQAVRHADNWRRALDALTDDFLVYDCGDATWRIVSLPIKENGND